ncbi:mRNA cleavage and polyadenylation factor subunit [Coemansia sp. Benny D115]|nr:mRNA cleavage and polyadenylation factor subunit [Coemansia sp. Benny D115]
MRDPTYTYCRELVPPSAIDRAISLSFTKPGARNLALARGSTLEVYQVELVLRKHPASLGGDMDDSESAADDLVYRGTDISEFGLPFAANSSKSARRAGAAAKQPQLRLVGRWALHGHIMDVQAIPGAQGCAERLLLSFAEAKMSVVGFDPATQGLTTDSIHYYEHATLRQRSFNDRQGCELRIDPEGRCVAMRIYDDKLAVLPLQQNKLGASSPLDAWPLGAGDGSGGGGGSGGGSSGSMSSFVLDLRADAGLRNVRDYGFLPGYLEPTMVVLHEQRPGWSGLTEVEQDTCAVSVVSVDLTRHSVSVLNSATSLPSDCCRLVTVPEPIGGALVIASSSLVHVAASGAISCISVINRVAARALNRRMLPAIDFTNEALGLVLDPPRVACAFVDSATTAALWTHHGAVFLLKMAGDGRLVRGIQIKQVAGPRPWDHDSREVPREHVWGDISVIPSCLCSMRLPTEDPGDGDYAMVEGDSADLQLLFVGGISGRSLLLGVDTEADKGTLQTLTSASLSGADSWASHIRFVVYDEILGTGGVISMAVGQPSVSAVGSGTHGAAGTLELVTGAGNEFQGCLRVQRRHVQPDVVASFDIPGSPVRQLWTARCLRLYNIGGTLQSADPATLAEMGDTFMILSRDDGTKVFSAGDELQELDANCGFCCQEPTVHVGEILSNTRVVQVHKSGIRMVDSSGKLVQRVLFNEESTTTATTVTTATLTENSAQAAEISDPFVLVHMRDGSFKMYEAMVDLGELRKVKLPKEVFLAGAAVVGASLFGDIHRVLLSNHEYLASHADSVAAAVAAASNGSGMAGDEAQKNANSTSAMTGGADFDSLYAEVAEGVGSDDRKRRARLGGSTATAQSSSKKESTEKRRSKRQRKAAADFADDFDTLYGDETAAAGKDSPHKDSKDAMEANSSKRASANRQADDDGDVDMADGAMGNAGDMGGEDVRGAIPVYLLLLLANGDMNIYRLPSFERLWTTVKFDNLSDTLMQAQPSVSTKSSGHNGRGLKSGSRGSDDDSSTSSSSSSSEEEEDDEDEGGSESARNVPKSTGGLSGGGGGRRKSARFVSAENPHVPSHTVDQFRLVQIGGDTITTLHLVVLTTSGEVAVYRAFYHYSPSAHLHSANSATSTEEASNALDDAQPLALRFTRVQHDVLAYEPEYERQVQRAQRKQRAVFEEWRKETEKSSEKPVGKAAGQRGGGGRVDEEAVVDWGDSSDDDEQSKDEMQGGEANQTMAVDEKQDEDIYADDLKTDAAIQGTLNAHDPLQAESAAAQTKEGEESEESEDRDQFDLVYTRKIAVLDNVGGYAAVFILGLRPMVVLVGNKQFARVHPVHVPGRLPTPLASRAKDIATAESLGLLSPWQPVVGVARFHSSACSHGLVALTQAGTLVIGALPVSVREARGGIEYDAPWPVRCLPVGTSHSGLSTLGGVVFHRPSGSYAVAAATTEKFYIKEPDPDIAARQAREESDGDAQAAVAPLVADADMQHIIPEHERQDLPTTTVPPLAPRAHIDLLSPVTWETVDTFSLDHNEHIVAMRTLELESAQSVGGRRAFLCVGTGFVLGEDVTSRGKVYIFDVVDVVPLPGRPQTNRKLKLLCQEELRGTVSALGELRGNLVVSVGSKVFVRSFQRNEHLVSVAFLDCQSFVKSLAGLNNFLLIGDLISGLWFTGFQEEGPTRVQILGRDATSRLEVEQAEFVILGSHMQMLAADSLGALHIFSYAPRDPHSAGGQRLLRRGEYNLRSRVTAAQRLVTAAGGSAVQQHVCLVATASGAVHAVAMLPERLFKRLFRITTQLVHGVLPLAGLNAREHRAVPLHRRQHHAARRTVLDGDLLAPAYAMGPKARQREAAVRDGTSADRVLRDIVETERSFAFF